MSTQIVFVEFDAEGRPFAIETRGDDAAYYAVDYCKRDDLIYCHKYAGAEEPISVEHEDGSYWSKPGLRVNASLARQRKRLRAPYTATALLECVNHPVARTHYCSDCDDFLPTPEYTDRICAHGWWCDDCDHWSLPGERCCEATP